MKSKPSPNPANVEHRQLEAAKTSRLRALRLAKEAEDRETAARLAAEAPAKPAKRRARATSHAEGQGEA